MMKKNYFGKLLAIAMIFAGFSLTSCDENDNAIIDGKVWVKPEVQLVDGGAIIKGSSPADITSMLGRIRKDMITAVGAGETFTINLETPQLNSTSSDNKISIPTPATQGDAKIVVNFTNNINTEEPLLFESMGVADNAVAALSTSKVEINLASGTSNVDLQLNMPTSTVTLKGGTIDELTATTAINTLIIESGVTVNWLKMKGGRAEVKEGGKVLGYIRTGDEEEGTNSDAYVGKEGVYPNDKNYGYGYQPDVYTIKDEAETPYYAEKLKIVKGETAKCAIVYIDNNKAENSLEMIIADGGVAQFEASHYWEDNVEKMAKISSIKGEGNAKIVGRAYQRDYGYWDPSIGEYGDWVPNLQYDEKGNPIWDANIDFSCVKELVNVTVDLTTHPALPDNSSGKWEYKEVKISSGDINLGPNSTDCNFLSPNYIRGEIKDDVMSKVTNCTLTCPIASENVYSNIYYINAINSKLTADNMSGMSPSSENSTFKVGSIEFTNKYVSGNSATTKGCKFETPDKNPNATIRLPYQTASRSSFNFTFDTCEFGKGFLFNIAYLTTKPWLDKDGKKVTKGYYWYELEKDGTTIKIDEDGGYIEKKSSNESDIPEANKANGETRYGNGYWTNEDSSGLTETAYFNDYKGIITFNNTKLDGKAITKDTDFISNVRSGYDEKGEIATTTRFVIGGVSYKAVRDTDTQKYTLIPAE